MTSRDPLQELEEALSFQTSPDFCARVRQQVATQPRRPKTFEARRLLLAAAVMLAATAGGLVMFREADPQVTEVRRPATSAESSPAKALDLHAGAKVPSSVATAQELPRSGQKETAPAFVTLVPDDQLRALERLLGAMRVGRATVPEAVLDEEVNDLGQRVPRALVIELMKLEPLAGMPGETGKDPVKDPIK
jgi:hypothetical protein